MRLPTPLAIIAVCCVSASSRAQWDAYYPQKQGQTDYKMTAMAVDSAGNTYAVGTVKNAKLDFEAVKFDATGKVLWTSTIGYPSADVKPAKVILDPSGNIISIGTLQFAGNVAYAFVTKLTNAGATSFFKPFALGGESTVCGLGSDSTGLIYWAGSGILSVRDYMYVFCLNANGTTKWQKSYNYSGENDFAEDFAADQSGNSYLVGTHTTANGTYVEVLKHDKNGNLLWRATYALPSGDFTTATALTVDPASNVYVTGVQRLSSQTYPDILTLKVAANGSIAWEKVFDGTSHGPDQGKAIAVDSAGNVYAAGATYVNGSGYRAVLLKYSNAGTVLGYVIPFTNAPNEIPHYLFVDRANRIYMAADESLYAGGTSNDVFAGYFDPALNNISYTEWGFYEPINNAGIYSDGYGHYIVGSAVKGGYGWNFFLRALIAGPVAAPDLYYANYGSTLSVGAAYGVQANDIYWKYTQATLWQANAGVVHLQSNGSFTWTPSANYFGTDWFSYYDGSIYANSAIVKSTIIVVPALSSVAVNPISVVGGTSSTGTIKLNHTVAAPNVVVGLSSSDPAAASVPPSVTLTSGQTQANFTVTTHSVAAAKTVTITSWWNGTVKTTTLTVNP